MRLKTHGGGSQQLIQEPVTMTATQAGRSAARVQTPAPPHDLRRVARFIVLRAAVSGRLAWPAALLVLRRLEIEP
jgi:hypothetical protein